MRSHLSTYLQCTCYADNMFCTGAAEGEEGWYCSDETEIRQQLPQSSCGGGSNDPIIHVRQPPACCHSLRTVQHAADRPASLQPCWFAMKPARYTWQQPQLACSGLDALV